MRRNRLPKWTHRFVACAANNAAFESGRSCFRRSTISATLFSWSSMKACPSFNFYLSSYTMLLEFNIQNLLSSTGIQDLGSHYMLECPYSFQGVETIVETRNWRANHALSSTGSRKILSFRHISKPYNKSATCQIDDSINSRDHWPLNLIGCISASKDQMLLSIQRSGR